MSNFIGTRRPESRRALPLSSMLLVTRLVHRGFYGCGYDKLMRCFVYFNRYKDLETAKKAMAELNGQVLAGRTVRIVDMKTTTHETTNDGVYEKQAI